MKHSSSRATGVLLMLAAFSACAFAGDGAKGSKVGYEVYTGYFESNKSGLKDDPVSFLAFHDAKAFDQVFGTAAVMGKKQKFLPKDAFDSKLVVAVIHRGNAPWRYDVERVTSAEGTLTLQYRARKENGRGATFASPLIVAVDKRDYSSVVFIENGKKTGTTKIGSREDR
jgi:hypothetical protein